MSVLASLTVHGLRGFASPQSVEFARPNDVPGSGLTVLVGANNAGKSTVLEALRAFAQRAAAPSFAQGRRNVAAGDRVSITLRDEAGQEWAIRSLHAGGSETALTPPQPPPTFPRLFALPSRRAFNPYFGKSEFGRDQYVRQYMKLETTRQTTVQGFESRLFGALANKGAFDEVLGEVLDPVPDWAIDQHDTGQYFLKFVNASGAHSSEGVGEGIVSLFFLVDALYDSQPGDVIAVDEPELSLHPALQRRVSDLFTKYAADRQIVVATHSPYFVNLRALEAGATVVRAHKRGDHSVLSQLKPGTAARFKGLLNDTHNPHVFGLKAQEVFFLEDPPVLVEGPEDVVYMGRVEGSIGVDLKGELFGWGVGGASKMGTVAQVLHDLGFERVCGILDNDKRGDRDRLSAKFPTYRFVTIPAKDIRTKPASPPKAEVKGLLDDKNRAVRPEHVEATRAVLNELNEYLKSGAAAASSDGVGDGAVAATSVIPTSEGEGFPTTDNKEPTDPNVP